ncbi:hypothetical protein X975_15123, partial [Stegodyphus mimosarum]
MQSLCILILTMVAMASFSDAHQRPSTFLGGSQRPKTVSDTQRANVTTKTSPSNKVTAKSARSDYPHHGYEHHYPHHYGHLGGFGHYKDLDHYLLPVLMVLGLGALLMPLLSVLMTTMVGNVPVTTLVSGRKKRE